MEVETLERPLATEQPATAIALPPETRAVIAMNSSKTELDLRALATKHVAIVEIKDRAGREQAHGAAMELMRARTDIEKVSKAARDDATKFSKAVIAEEKRLVSIVEPEEKRLKDLRDQWDDAEKVRREAEAAAERARVLAITTRIADIKSKPALAAQCRTAAAVQRLIDSLESADMNGFEEFEAEALAARSTALESMIGLRDAKQAEEDERARIKAEQEAEAARLAAEREAQAKAAAELQAKLDAQAAELARQREAFEVQQAAALAAQQAEAKRLAEQAAELAREQWERQREADIAEGARIWREAGAAGAEPETCPDSSITGKVVDANPDLDPAVPVAADLPVSMEPPHLMDPSDADVIWEASRAVADAFGMTQQRALQRLAEINDWILE